MNDRKRVTSELLVIHEEESAETGTKTMPLLDLPLMLKNSVSGSGPEDRNNLLRFLRALLLIDYHWKMRLRSSTSRMTAEAPLRGGNTAV